MRTKKSSQRSSSTAPLEEGAALCVTVTARAKLVLWLGVVVIVAAILRIREFQAFATLWDPCEYVWAVRDHYLPHSPYIGYLWSGIILSTVLEPAFALSLLSFVGGITVVVLVGLVVQRQTHSLAGAVVAAAAMAVSPVAVRFGGLQEVYAIQAALAVSAFYFATYASRHASIASGVFYGCAFTFHNGTLFLLPFWIFALFAVHRNASNASGARTDRTSILWGVCAAACVISVAYGWTAWVFYGTEDWVVRFFRYLRGIAPAPNDLTVMDGVDGYVKGVLSAAFGPAWPGRVVFLLSLGLVIWRDRRSLLFWMLWATPYALYEILLGRNLDPGIYASMALPAVAATVGLASACVVRACSGNAPKFKGTVPALVVTLTAIMLATVGHAAWQRPVTSRDAFFRRRPIVSLQAIASHATANAYIAQPPVKFLQPNLVPVYGQRRPMFFFKGRAFFFSGQPWTELNLRSFEELPDDRVQQMLVEGGQIFALKRAAQSVGTWRAVLLPTASGPVRVFRLEPP